MFRAHAARDHVALASRGVPPSAAQRDRLHALLPELAGLWASPVARLTRRARRIVDLARAIVAEPRLVLLDELALDLGAERAGEVVRALAREGRTVLVAERFPEPLIGLADAAWVLHQGRVLLCGHPSDVARDDRLWGACIGDLPPPATR